VGKARPLVAPIGDVVPFGSMGIDTAVDWFRSMVLRGHRFLNWFDGMEHGWFNDRRGGHGDETQEDLYRQSEENAKNFLLEKHERIFEFD
jgi:hypothetical protein